MKDASQAPAAVSKLINPNTKENYINEVKQEYSQLRDNAGDKKADLFIGRPGMVTELRKLGLNCISLDGELDG